MRKPRLLDLFCGAGGAGMGYAKAGFDVVGVDLSPQPNYPFEFVQADALTFPLEGFDAIHASPPCQAHTMMKHVAWNYRDDHRDFIPDIRARLVACGKPYVIENVPGAPLHDPIVLCGTSFGLGLQTEDGWYDLQRHRLFESNVPLFALSCKHGKKTVGVYGDHLRNSRRSDFSPRQIVGTIRLYGVVAHGHKSGMNFSRGGKVLLGQIAMGMPWCESWHGIKEAIPPVYTEFIGGQIAQQCFLIREVAV